MPNEWVNVRKSSLMKDSNDSMGLTEHGLEHYLKIIIEQNYAMVGLLVDMKNELSEIRETVNNFD